MAKAASLELVECVGEYDPSLSSQLLALHQVSSAGARSEGGNWGHGSNWCQGGNMGVAKGPTGAWPRGQQ